MPTDLEQTPEGAGGTAEAMRQGEIARDDALSPVPAGRAYGVGTTLADDFIAAENLEEHDGEPGIEARGYWAGIWLRLKKD